MAFTGPMEDRLAIRELHDSYGDAVFRADGDEWGGHVDRGRRLVADGE